MTLTEFPWMFFGRRVRPYAFSVMYVTFVISWYLLVSGQNPGDNLDRTFAGIVVGICGMISVILLFGGFWLDNDHLMLVGLLLTSGAWCARGVYITLEQGINQPGLLSFGWVMASMGSFFLEFFTGDHTLLRRRRV